jgi:hypothetical protein
VKMTSSTFFSFVLSRFLVVSVSGQPTRTVHRFIQVIVVVVVAEIGCCCIIPFHPLVRILEWGADLISINWRYINELWTQRNVEQLGSTDTEKESRRKQNLIRSINSIQRKYGESLPPSQSILI